MSEDLDAVFKALADPSRRRLLDSLRNESGQTLGQLCGQLDMARQSATQHLAVLEAANLISTVRRSREKLHYLNPVPIYEIQRRWLAPFDQPRLRDLDAVKRSATEIAVTRGATEIAVTRGATEIAVTRGATEIAVTRGATEMHAEKRDMTMDKPTFVYVTYIESTPERVWHALTDADLTAAYWGHSNVSDWQPGSIWEHRRTDGSGIADVVGKVLEAVPPTRLVITFDEPGGTPAGGPSTVTFQIEAYQEIVRLTVTHENLAGDEALQAISQGWPAVLANLKSLLETGHVLPQAPWEMHAELRDEQMARNRAR